MKKLKGLTSPSQYFGHFWSFLRIFDKVRFQKFNVASTFEVHIRERYISIDFLLGFYKAFDLFQLSRKYGILIRICENSIPNDKIIDSFSNKEKKREHCFLFFFSLSVS